MTRLLSASVDRGVIEALMGHRFGLDSAYLRLTEEEIGNMYLKAMPSLTIMSSGNELTQKDIKNEVELGIWHLMVSGAYGEPSALIKNYELLPTVEKIKALKTIMLKVVHDAGDFLDITDPAKFTVEHVGVSLPVRAISSSSVSAPSGTMLIENTRKYDSILINQDDEHRILAYANRGYEIAGTVNGRIMMRKVVTY